MGFNDPTSRADRRYKQQSRLLTSAGIRDREAWEQEMEELEAARAGAASPEAKAAAARAAAARVAARAAVKAPVATRAAVEAPVATRAAVEAPVATRAAVEAPVATRAAADPSLLSSSLEPERQQHTDTELMELVGFLNKCLNYKVLKTIQNRNTLKNAIAEARRSSEYQKEMDNEFYDSITWEQFKNYINELNTSEKLIKPQAIETKKIENLDRYESDNINNDDRLTHKGGKKRRKSKKIKYKKSKKHHKRKSRNKRR